MKQDNGTLDPLRLRIAEIRTTNMQLIGRLQSPLLGWVGLYLSKIIEELLYLFRAVDINFFPNGFIESSLESNKS